MLTWNLKKRYRGHCPANGVRLLWKQNTQKGESPIPVALALRTGPEISLS